jgi:hypothetical protein
MMALRRNVKNTDFWGEKNDTISLTTVYERDL